MPKYPAFPDEIFVAIDEDDDELYAYRDEHSALGVEAEDVLAVYRLIEVNKTTAERILSRTPVRRPAKK